MSDEIYAEALENIQHRLGQARIPAIHTVLFGVVASISGILQPLLVGIGVRDGVVYWGIFFWSIVVFIHNLPAYRRSGERKDRRELIIQQELLKLAHAYDLSTDELVDLHERLSDDVSQRAAPFTPLIFAAGGYFALWVGMMVAGLTLYLNITSMPREFITIMLQGVPLTGTVIITCALVLTLIRLKGEETPDVWVAHLRTIYSKKTEKRKHAASTRLAIDDEGELVLNEMQPQEQAIQR
jgi:hypothetical protein